MPDEAFASDRDSLADVALPSGTVAGELSVSFGAGVPEPGTTSAAIAEPFVEFIFDEFPMLPDVDCATPGNGRPAVGVMAGTPAGIAFVLVLPTVVALSGGAEGAAEVEVTSGGGVVRLPAIPEDAAESGVVSGTEVVKLPADSNGAKPGAGVVALIGACGTIGVGFVALTDGACATGAGVVALPAVTEEGSEVETIDGARVVKLPGAGTGVVECPAVAEIAGARVVKLAAVVECAAATEAASGAGVVLFVGAWRSNTAKGHETLACSSNTNFLPLSIAALDAGEARQLWQDNGHQFLTRRPKPMAGSMSRMSAPQPVADTRAEQLPKRPSRGPSVSSHRRPKQAAYSVAASKLGTSG